MNEMQTAVAETHECRKDDCHKRLNVNNKSGYCSKHFYISKQDACAAPNEPRQPARQERLEAVVQAAVAKDENSAMTLLLSGTQADRFFKALKPEDKCMALQGLFDRLGE